MLKIVTEKVDRLRTSVVDIMGSAAEDRDALLRKSFDEFREDLVKAMAADTFLPPEPLAKGLNHVASFASALSALSNVVDGICNRMPYANMPVSYSGLEEEVSDDVKERMQRVVEHGALVLRDMVDETVEEAVEQDDEAEKAEKPGTLVKVEGFDGSVVTVRTKLPQHLAAYASDRLVTVEAKLQLAKALYDDGLDELAAMEEAGALPEGYLAKADPEDEDEDDDAEPGADDGADAGADGGDPVDLLDMIHRLAAAQLVAAEMLRRAADGDIEEGDGDLERADEDDTARKADAPPRAAALAKGAAAGEASPETPDTPETPERAMILELAKQVGTLTGVVENFTKSMPAPPRGVLRAIDKGGDGRLSTEPDITELPPEQQTLELIKRAQRGRAFP